MEVPLNEGTAFPFLLQVREPDTNQAGADRELGMQEPAGEERYRGKAGMVRSLTHFMIYLRANTPNQLVDDAVP